MKCVNVKNNTIRILGIHFSYNRRLENGENYRRYIINFKTLATSKVVHIALVKGVPSSTIAQLEKNTKAIYLEKRKS